MAIYDSGILMTTGFSIASKKPADLKYLAKTIEERNSYVTNNLAYEGMLVFVEATKKVYIYSNNVWKEFGFNAEEFASSLYNGLDSDSIILGLTAAQGKALNTKITTHTSNTTIHITDNERTSWNAKASTALATQTANGLMSSTDKAKLDSIATGANAYTHPATHPASIITQDDTHRFVTDAEKATWNGLITEINTLKTQQAEMLAKLKTAVFI